METWESFRIMLLTPIRAFGILIDGYPVYGKRGSEATSYELCLGRFEAVSSLLEKRYPGRKKS
jgi:hypothetical protein